MVVQPQVFNFEEAVSPSSSAGSNNDLSYLLPVVTPILDEYEEEDHSTIADQRSLLGLDEKVQHDQRMEETYQNAIVEDDGASVSSDMTEYSEVSEELRYYHNVVAKRAMSLDGEDEDAVSDVCAGNHDELEVEIDESLLLRRTVPQLPRPRLWTLSERGESTATKNSDYLNSVRCSSFSSPRSVGIAEIAEDEPWNHHHRLCVWMSEAGVKVLTAIIDLPRAMITKARSESDVQKSVSFQPEDPTVTSSGEFSWLKRDDISNVSSSFLKEPPQTAKRRNSPFTRRRRMASF